MLTNLISIGDKIDLKRISNGDIEVRTSKQYVSQLLEYDQVLEAVIAMPIEGGKVIPLETGDIYQLYFYTNKGLYQCSAVIITRYRENNIYLLKVRFISDFEKYQRRQYYRLNCFISMEYRVESKEEKQYLSQISEDQFDTAELKSQCKEDLNQIQSVWFDGITNDISGGGLRFNSTKQCQKEDHVRVRLDISNPNKPEKIILLAKVISSLRLPNKQGYFEHRIEFIELSNELRETIIRFIFQEERRIRRKEKGLD